MSTAKRTWSGILKSHKTEMWIRHVPTDWFEVIGCNSAEEVVGLTRNESRAAKKAATILVNKKKMERALIQELLSSLRGIWYHVSLLCARQDSKHLVSHISFSLCHMQLFPFCLPRAASILWNRQKPPQGKHRSLFSWNSVTFHSATHCSRCANFFMQLLTVSKEKKRVACVCVEAVGNEGADDIQLRGQTLRLSGKSPSGCVYNRMTYIIGSTQWA